MRSAIVTDIHANIQAWEAVLKDIDKMGCSEILCLGDVIGYGPNPAEVMDSTYGRLNACILGNHDAVIAGRLDKELFNDNAKMIIEWTEKQLSRDAVAYFADMPLVMECDDFLCAHAELASPGRFNYIYDTPDAVASFEAVTQPLMFVGHTHLPCYFELDPQSNLRKKPSQDFIVSPGSRFLVNAGSVGDPRDGRVAASYVIYDHDLRKVIFRQVPFDIQGFRRNLLASGLPTTPFFLRVADGQMQETQTLKDMIVSDKAVKDNGPGIARIGSQSQPQAGRKLNFAASNTSSRYQAAKDQKAASSKTGLYIGAGLVGFAALAIGGMMIAPHDDAPTPAPIAVNNASPVNTSATAAAPATAGLVDGGKLLRVQIERTQLQTKSSGIPYVIDIKAGSGDILARELTRDAKEFTEPSSKGTTIKMPEGLSVGTDVRLVFWHDGSNYSSSPEILISQTGGKSAPLKLDDPEKKTHQGNFLALAELTERGTAGLLPVSALSHHRRSKKIPASVAQYYEDDSSGDIQLKIQIPKEGLADPVLKLVLQSLLKELVDGRSGLALPVLNQSSLYDQQVMVYNVDLSKLSRGSTVLTLKGKNKPRLVSATLGTRLPQVKSDWRFGEVELPVTGTAKRTGSALESSSGVEFQLPSYEWPSQGFTFDLVVKIDDSGSGSALFSCCTEVNKQLTAGFRITSDSRGLILEAPGQKSAALPLHKGKWQRVVFSWNPAERKALLCANGIAQVLELSAMPMIPAGPLVIGAFRDDNQKAAPALKGALHHARILPGPLNQMTATALSAACPTEDLLNSGLSPIDIPAVYPPDDVAPLFTLAAASGNEPKAVAGWYPVQNSDIASWKKDIDETRSAVTAAAEKELLAKQKALNQQASKLAGPIEALMEGRSDTALTALKSLPDSTPLKDETIKLVADEKMAVHDLMKTLLLGRTQTLSLVGDTKLDFKPTKYEPKTMTWTGKKMNGTKEVNTVDVCYSKLASSEIEERIKKLELSPECKTLLLLRAGLTEAAKTEAEAAGSELAGVLLELASDKIETLLSKADYKLGGVDASSQYIGKASVETGEFVIWIVAENITKAGRLLAVLDTKGSPLFFFDQNGARLFIIEKSSPSTHENKVAVKSLIKIRYKDKQMSFADLCGEGKATGTIGLPESLKGAYLNLGRGFTVQQLCGFNTVPDEASEKMIEASLKKKWKLP